MLKQATRNLNANQIADAAVAASRQLWLAGLGAAAVTRQWATNDAGAFFRTLVRQGEVAESRAKRVINSEMESSVAKATRIWKSTRHAVAATVNTIAETAAAALPSPKAPVRAKRRAQPAKKAATATRSRARRAVRTVKRGGKKA